MTPEEIRLKTANDRLRKAFLNDDFGEAGAMLNQGVGSLLQDQKAVLRNSAVAGWASLRTGQTINPNAPDWQGVKDGLTRGYFRIQDAGPVGDEQIFGYIKEDLDATDKAVSAGITAALSGKPYITEAQTFTDSIKAGNLKNRVGDYEKMMRRAYNEYAAKVQKYRPLVNSLAAEIKAGTGQEAGEFSFDSVLNRLEQQVPPEDFDLVLNAIGATGKTLAGEESGKAMDMLRSAGRTAERAVSSGKQALKTTTATGFGLMLGAPGVLLAQEMVAPDRERGAKLERLRRVAYGEVSPIDYQDSAWRFGMQTAEGVVTIASAMVPVAGIVALNEQFRNDNNAQLQEAGLTFEQSDRISGVISPIQTGVEIVMMNLMLGRLPAFERLLKSPILRPTSFLTRFGVRTGVAAAGEITEEMVQQALVPIGQEVAAAFSSDIPGPDWQKHFDSIAQVPGEMWGSALILSAIGGGGASIRDVRNGRALVRDTDALVAFGASPALAQEIRAAVDAGNLGQAEVLLRRTINPATEDAATADERKRAITLLQGRAEAEATDLRQKMADAGVYLRKSGNEWQVESSDGKLNFPSAQEAVTFTNDLLRQRGQALDEKTTTALSQISESMQADEQVRLENIKRTLLNEFTDAELAGDQAQVDEIYRRLELERQKNKRPDLVLSDVAVLGRSKLEFREGVKTYTIRLFKEGRAGDLIEEKAENVIRRAINEGRATIEQLRAAIQATEAATGDQYLMDQSEAGVLEAFSSMTRLYSLGTRRSDVARTMQAQERQTRRAERDRLKAQEGKDQTDPQVAGLVRILRDTMEFFKVVLGQARRLAQAGRAGKLADMQKFLDETLGLTEQMAHEEAVVQQVEEVAGIVTPQQFQEGDQELTQPLELFHGGLFESATIEDVDLNRPGTQQNKRGRSYGGFYLTDETSRAWSESYAQQRGSALHRVTLAPGSRVQYTSENIDRLSAERRAELAKKYDAIRGLDALGRSQWVLLNKNAVQEMRTEPQPKAILPGGVVLTEPGTFSVQVYHGTGAKIDKFDTSKITAMTAYGWGLNFAERRSLALNYAETEDGDPGYLYTVNLLPDQNQFLDYNLTLGEQPEPVRAALAKLGMDIDPAASVQELYDELTQAKGSMKGASLALAKAGIPGLRYLDGGSRSKTSQQFRNYVLFEGKLAEILAEDKQAGTYSTALVERLEVMAETMGRQYQSKPEERRVILGRMQDLFAKARANWEALPEKRTLEDIRREAKTREAFEYDEFLKDQFQADTPAKQAALTPVERAMARSEAKAAAEKWQTAEIKRTASEGADQRRLQAAMRTLDAVLSALPAEIRGRVGGFIKLVELGSDETRIAEIEKRFDRIGTLLEKYFQKELTAQLEKLIQKSQPTGEGGEKVRGKIGVEAHRWFSRVEAVLGLSSAEAAGEQAKQEDILNNPDTTAEQQQEALETWTILNQFGAWNDKAAAEMDAALTLAESVYAKGRSGWLMQLEARKQQREELRKQGFDDLGIDPKGWAGVQQKTGEEAKRGQIGKIADWVNRHFSFQQLLGDIFGMQSRTMKYFEAKSRAATIAKTEAMIAKREAYRKAMLAIFGARSWRVAQKGLMKLHERQKNAPVTFYTQGGTETISVPAEKIIDLIEGRGTAEGLGLTQEEAATLMDEWSVNESTGGQKSVFTVERLIQGQAEAGTELSQMEAVHFTMLARQEEYRAAMNKHGITNDTLAQMEEWLTDEAKAVRAWLFSQYAQGYDGLNAVYQRMFGADLPQVKEYAPGYFETDNKVSEVDPFGSGMEATGLAAGFLKKRKNHRARPKQIDALQAYWQHTMQVEHWKAWAELVSEMRSVLGNADMLRAVTIKSGTAASKDVLSWIDAFEQNGVRDAQANDMMQKIMRAQARIALAYKVGVMLKQLPAAVGALGDISAGAFVRGASRVLTGEAAKPFSEMWKSRAIQRRVESGYSPEMRIAMRGINAKPDVIGDVLEFGMQGIAWTDATFTAFSAAVAYDEHYRQALKMGANEKQAAAIAMERTEATIGRTAQPGELMDRSLAEMQAVGLGKMLFMFQSAQRQAFALVYANWKAAMRGESGATAAAARTTFLHFILVPAITQTMAGLIRYMFTDDDAEEAWTVEDYVTSMILGPMSGIMLFGAALDVAVHQGGFTARRSNNPLVEAINSLISKSTKDDIEPKDVAQVAADLSFLASGFVNPSIEGVGVTWNVLKQIMGLTENVTEGKK